MKLIIIVSFFITACSPPFSKKASVLIFSDKKEVSIQDPNVLLKKVEILNKEKEEKQRLFDLEKKSALNEINEYGKKTFEDLRPLFDQKCMNCHNRDFKLPFYGRIFNKINPVKKHQDDGLKSLDYSGGFPFKANGNPPQIALLKSIRNAFLERTMPLKSFTFVYPNKKISHEDEQLVLNWIDPLIEKLEQYNLKYNTTDSSIPGKAKNVLELKCFRCHAFGNQRGGFSGMENMTDLLKSKYINLESVDKSKLIESMVTGSMPPSKLEAISNEEINFVRDWIEFEVKKLKKENLKN